MKKLLIFLMIGSVLFAFKVNINPWTMKMGEVSLSLGFPTFGIRYGIIDNAEVGMSMKELGGYFKLGISDENYAVSVGISSFTFESAMVFGSAGIHFGNVWTSLGGGYREVKDLFSDKTTPKISFSGEVYLEIMEKGNMNGGIGTFLQYEKMGDGYLGGVYASSTFKKVWFIDHVDMFGGVAVHYDPSENFSLLQNLSVVFDISLDFYLFRR